MENNYEIKDLFPTPVLKTTLPSSFSPITKQLMKEEMSSSLVTYGSRSKTSYILNSPQYSEFSSYILDIVKNYGNNILNFNYNTYKFTQSWISLKKPNESHNEHTHPNSIISGVFYFGPYEESTPGICFHKQETSPGANILYPKFSNESNKYNANQFNFNIHSGLLLLFPSYLKHSVPLNTTKNKRYSLAFNIISPEGLGEEGLLSELKFN